MKPNRYRLLPAVLALTMALAAPVAATAQTLLGGPTLAPAKVMLHSGWSEPDGRRIAALRMDLAPGWKTYWRNPGAAGIPPHFDWTGSKNIREVRVIWPRPLVFESFGMRTIGYKDQMILPLAISVEDDARPIRLRLSLSYGVCEEICVPAQQDLALDILPGEAPDGAEIITAAIGDAPQRANRGGFGDATCEIRPDEKIFEARIVAPGEGGAAPVVVAEGGDAIFGELDSRFETGALVAAGEIRSNGWIDRGALRLTIISPDEAYYIEGCPAG